jgi:ABC-type ATPase with predicted acetyltransferase domain
MRKDYGNMGTSKKNDNWTPNKQKLTPCICPRCKSKHAKLLFWTGKIPALKFCQSCEQIAERDYAPETYALGYRDIDELISY